MRILITGINGFAGSHLAELLINSKSEIFGLVLPGTSLDNIKHIRAYLTILKCDICNFSALKRVLADCCPDAIYHLAAVSNVAHAFSDPRQAFKVNVLGTLNLLEALRSLSVFPKLLLVGSSEVYGSVQSKVGPVKESAVLHPQNPYAVSKATVEMLGAQYFKNFNFKVICTRSFNHCGPRQAESFAISSFAKQIAMIEKGKQPPVIKVGNLDCRRDFTDVRDMVRAYVLALKKGKPGEVYNISSGKSHAIFDILQTLLGYSTKRISIQKDPARTRPTDARKVAGDSRKLKKITGWKTQIPLATTLLDTLNYWREKVF